MPRDEVVDLQTQCELLRIALGNARRSVAPLVLAMSLVAVGGWQAGAQVAAALAGGLGLATAAWRWGAAGWLLVRTDQDERWLRVGTVTLELNAAAAGLAWSIASVGVYPSLHGSLASIYVAIICGSIAVASYFMAMVGRAFLILVVLELGSFLLVNLWFASLGSLALALLTFSFALPSYRAAKQFRQATVSALQHGREVDRANAALTAALEAAQAANLAKSQFLATMSHEIRTPMNGVLGALELLQRSPLDARQTRLVQTAASSGSTLMNILNEVLDHSKIEAGRLELVPVPTSLKALAESVLSLLRSNAEAKGLALTLEHAAQAPDWVMVDGQRLKQVLLNLVGNAIKFTDRGRVSLGLQPAAPAAPELLGLRIEVRDSGVGIAAADLGEVFEPFHQCQAANPGRRTGTGLGLSISQRIVEAMGGRIALSSTPGLGSSFSFVLQLSPAPLAAPAPVPDRPGGAERSLGGVTAAAGKAELSGTVLVAEDNPVNRLIACELLGSLGLQVLTAENGALALSVLAQHPVDVVLMDVQMPVLNGYAATRAIREREGRNQGSASRHLPIVAVTANAFATDIALAHAAGMDAHLAKPYSLDELAAVLHRLL